MEDRVITSEGWLSTCAAQLARANTCSRARDSSNSSKDAVVPPRRPILRALGSRRARQKWNPLLAKGEFERRVDHRNVSIIAIVGENARERESGGGGERKRREKLLLLFRTGPIGPYLPADLWGRGPLSYHHCRAISLSRYDHGQVLGLVITPIKYACRRDLSVAASFVFVAKAFLLPRSVTHRATLHSADKRRRHNRAGARNFAS